MLAANEAVATSLTEKEIGFLRRAHPDPEAFKLLQFAEFVRSLGLAIDQPQSRFELQRVLNETIGKPEEYAVHYGLLRSLKQASYTPEPEGHYALASQDYCHFTSPIRRYPDLQVHRQLIALLEGKKPRAKHDELVVLGQHCTRTERRAEAAERELIRVKLLSYLRRPRRQGLPRHHRRSRRFRPVLPAERTAGGGPDSRHQSGGRLLLSRSRARTPWSAAAPAADTGWAIASSSGSRTSMSTGASWTSFWLTHRLKREDRPARPAGLQPEATDPCRHREDLSAKTRATSTGIGSNPKRRKGPKKKKSDAKVKKSAKKKRQTLIAHCDLNGRASRGIFSAHGNSIMSMPAHSGSHSTNKNHCEQQSHVASNCDGFSSSGWWRLSGSRQVVQHSALVLEFVLRARASNSRLKGIDCETYTWEGFTTSSLPLVGIKEPIVQNNTNKAQKPARYLVRR